MSAPIAPFNPRVSVSASPTVVSYPQNDKIIQDISECISDLKADFEENCQPFTDDNQQLHRFCAKLEYLLRADMKDKYTMLGKKKDYWDYLCDCLGSTKGINDGIKYVKTVGDYKTSVGKGRAFLRFCLMHNRMADSLQACIMNGKVTSDWFHPKSIWLNHDKSSKLINSLYDLSEIQFDLASRGYDLDNAWPSFARKTQQGNNNWNPPSRADSMSSLISIPIQERRIDSFNESFDIEGSMKLEFSDQIDALEQQKKSLQQSVMTKQTELDMLQGQVTDMKSQNEALIAETKDLQRRLDKACIETESKENEMKLKEELHQKEVHALQEETRKSELLVKNLQGKLDCTEGSQGSYMTKVLELEKGNADLQVQICSLMSDLSASVEADEKKLELITSHEKKISTLEMKNQELLQKLENMIISRNSESSSKLDSVNQMQDLLKNLKTVESEKLKAETQLEETLKVCETLRVELDNVKEEKLHFEESMKSQINELEARIEKQQKNAAECEMVSEKKLRELTVQLDDVSEKHRCSVEHVQKLESDKNSLELDLNKEKEMLDQSDKVVMDLKSDINQKSQEYCLQITELQETIESQGTIIKEMESKSKQSQEQISILELKLSERDSEKASLNDKLSSIDKEKEELEHTCVTLKTELKHATEKSEMTNNSKEENQKLLQEKLQDLENRDKTIDNMIHAVKWLEKSKENTQLQKVPYTDGNREFICVIENLHKHLHSVNEKLTSNISETISLREHLETCIHDLKSKETLVAHMEEQSKSQMEQINSFKSEKDLLQTELSEKVKSLAICESKIEKLKNELQEKECENQKVSRQYEETVSHCHKLEEDLACKNTEICSLQEQSCKTEADLKQKSHHEVAEIRKSLQEKVKHHEQLMSSKTAHIKQLENSLSQVENELSNQKTETNQWRQKFDSLQEELNRQSHKNEKLKKEISDLQSVVKDSQSDKVSIEEKKKIIQTKLFDLENNFSMLQDEKKREEKEHRNVLEHLETERTDLKVKLEEALTDLHNIQEQLKHTSSQLELVDTEKERSENENQELQSVIQKKNENITALENENQRLSAELSSVNENVKGILMQHKEVGDESQKQKTEIMEQNKVIERLQAEEKWQRNEICNLNEKLQSAEKELEGNSNTWKIEKNKFEEIIASLEESIKELKEERETLHNKIRDSEKESEEKSKQNEKLEQSVKEALEENAKLIECKSEDNRNAESYKLEIDTMKQEISALQFQMSTDQIEHEKSLQTYTSRESDVESYREKIEEKDKVIDRLQKELETMMAAKKSEFDDNTTQIEELKMKLQTIEKERSSFAEEILKLRKDLESEKIQVTELKSRDEDQNEEMKKFEENKNQEIAQLKSDMKQLKKKVVQLIKEKDSLWQKTDQLTYEQKLQASEKWMDEKKVTHCLGCSTEFSFIVRKHHCRLCGKVYCYNCSNNFVDTAHSSKKSRACNTCFTRFNQSHDLSSSMLSRLEDEEDSQGSEGEQPSVNSESIRPSSAASISTTTDRSKNFVQLKNEERTPQEPTDREQSNSNVPMVPGQVATNISISVVGQNETDEIKRVKQTGTGEKLETSTSDDVFHLISDEEITRSTSLNSDDASYQNSDPNVTTGVTLTADELEKGHVSNSSEVWVKAGKSFAIPVVIDKPNTTLCWEFTSHPKDVVFSITYSEFDVTSSPVTHTLVPACKCDSHKQAVKGELTAKQTGIYSLLFDNTYSRLTAKRISYTLWTRHQRS